MAEVIEIAIDEGATTINVPDTVGYAMPDEYGEFWQPLRAGARTWPRSRRRSTATTTSGWPWPTRSPGVTAGARQVECTVNGIGERAGNASLEEVVMVLHTRASTSGSGPASTRADRAHARGCVAPHRLPGAAEQGGRRPQRVRARGGHPPGRRAQGAHTYEIMDATTIGLETNTIVLGKHSGRHALRKALEELGFESRAPRSTPRSSASRSWRTRRRRSRRSTSRRSSRTR